MDEAFPIEAWIRDSFRERILRARAQPPDEKLLAGPDLFDMVCRLMADGIRSEQPHIDNERVRQVVNERLALARRLEAYH